MSQRPGAASLAELLLVAVLFSFVLAALATFASAVSRLAGTQSERGRVQELARTAQVILQGELRHSVAEQVVAAAGDSVRLRAVRGGGVACGVEGDRLLVRYRGVRQPEPEKDSVLLVNSVGTHSLGPVRDAAAGGWCGGGVSLRLNAPPPESAGVVLIYESGTYMVAEGALRYRRGAAGRQPLTEAILGQHGSYRSALVVGSDAATLDLVMEEGVMVRPGPQRSRLVVRRLNGNPFP